MSWLVLLSVKAARAAQQLPAQIQEVLGRLVKEIETRGPVRGNWANYSKLGKGQHHCHLNKMGRPTYVACWEVKDKESRLVEVYYVGTREKAPY